MSLTENPFVVAFLDDMVDVGVKQWALMTLMAALLTYGLWGTSIIPFVGIIGVVFTANLVFATAVAAWWQYVGSHRAAYSTLRDRVKQQEGRK